MTITVLSSTIVPWTKPAELGLDDLEGEEKETEIISISFHSFKARGLASLLN